MITIIKKSAAKELKLEHVKIGDTFRLASGCGGLYIKILNRGDTSMCYSFYVGEETAILNSERCVLVDCEVHWEDRK